MCREQNNIYTDAWKAAVAAVLELEKSGGGSRVKGRKKTAAAVNIEKAAMAAADIPYI